MRNVKHDILGRTQGYVSEYALCSCVSSITIRNKPLDRYRGIEHENQGKGPRMRRTSSTALRFASFARLRIASTSSTSRWRSSAASTSANRSLNSRREMSTAAGLPLRSTRMGSPPLSRPLPSVDQVIASNLCIRPSENVAGGGAIIPVQRAPLYYAALVPGET